MASGRSDVVGIGVHLHGGFPGGVVRQEPCVDHMRSWGGACLPLRIGCGRFGLMFWVPLILSGGILAIGILIKHPWAILVGSVGIAVSFWYMTHPDIWQVVR